MTLTEKRTPRKKILKHKTRTTKKTTKSERISRVVSEPDVEYQVRTNKDKKMEKEICNECGKSVKFGSGLYVNRIPDFNEYEDRLKMQKPFPEGDFVCIECDVKFN